MNPRYRRHACWVAIKRDERSTVIGPSRYMIFVVASIPLQISRRQLRLAIVNYPKLATAVLLLSNFLSRIVSWDIGWMANCVCSLKVASTEARRDGPPCPVVDIWVVCITRGTSRWPDVDGIYCTPYFRTIEPSWIAQAPWSVSPGLRRRTLAIVITDSWTTKLPGVAGARRCWCWCQCQSKYSPSQSSISSFLGQTSSFLLADLRLVTMARSTCSRRSYKWDPKGRVPVTELLNGSSR